MSGVSDEQEHWLYNYVLNSLLRAELDVRLRQTLFNFLRRAPFAFREYALACWRSGGNGARSSS
jgi:hypothetical protein